MAGYIGRMLRLLQRISDALPGQCVVCHRWPAQPVCDGCIERFAQPVLRCRTCATPVPGGLAQCGACVLAPGPMDACVAAVPYAYPWSRLIGQFKFDGQPGWATSLSILMRSAPWVEPALDQADLVVPMPLARQRLRQRGFNQALELARCLAPGKTVHDLLLRRRDTVPQTSLKRAARMRNLQDAFVLDPLRAQRLEQARVVLIDDVMTSGASLHAAARVLRAGGAAHITGMVLARADRHGHDS